METVVTSLMFLKYWNNF